MLVTIDHASFFAHRQSCPTDEQVDAYSHIVIAFAVSYTWSEPKNNCDTQCNIASTVPICDNANNQALVDEWRSMGKKVILSFGGAGMGGSWSGDNNNCVSSIYDRDASSTTNLTGYIVIRFSGITASVKKKSSPQALSTLCRAKTLMASISTMNIAMMLLACNLAAADKDPAFTLTTKPKSS